MREGIAFAGNLIVDRIRKIDRLPKRSELAAIRGVGRSTGGACNNAIGMKKLDPAMPVSIYGAVGTDGEGDYILFELSRCGVKTKGVLRRGETSFTDAYLESETACRTFFHFGGVNDTLDVDDIPCGEMNERLFHIVYLLLLKTLDLPDEQYGTRLARLLHSIRESGKLLPEGFIKGSVGAGMRSAAAFCWRRIAGFPSEKRCAMAMHRPSSRFRRTRPTARW